MKRQTEKAAMPRWSKPSAEEPSKWRETTVMESDRNDRGTAGHRRTNVYVAAALLIDVPQNRTL